MTNSNSSSFLLTLKKHVNLIWCSTSFLSLFIERYYNGDDNDTSPHIFVLLLLNALAAHAVFFFTVCMKYFLGGEASFETTMLSELKTRFIHIIGHKIYIFVTLLLGVSKNVSFLLAYIITTMTLSQLGHAAKLKVEKLLKENEQGENRKTSVRLATILISLIATVSLALGIAFCKVSALQDVEQFQRLSNFLSTDGRLNYCLLLVVDNVTILIKMIGSLFLILLDSYSNIHSINKDDKSSTISSNIAAATDLEKDRVFLINTIFPSFIDLASFCHLLHIESLVGFNLSLFDLYIWLSLRAVGERLVERYSKFKLFLDMKHILDKKLTVYTPKKRITLKTTMQEDIPSGQGVDGLRRRVKGEEEEGGERFLQKAEKEEIEIEEEKECSICMDIIADGRICPTCKNIFHRHCLREYFVRKGELAWTCPLCVAILKPAQSVPEVVINQNAPLPRRGDQGNPIVRNPNERLQAPILYTAVQGVFNAFLGAASEIRADTEIGRNLLEMFPNAQPQALFRYASQFGVNATVDAVANGLIPLNEEATVAAAAAAVVAPPALIAAPIDTVAPVGTALMQNYRDIDSTFDQAAVETVDSPTNTSAANERIADEVLQDERRLRRLAAAESRLAQLR